MRSLLQWAWYDFSKRVLQLAAASAYGVRYTGREHIPAQGGVLLVCNHQSHLDPPLVGLGCPRHINFIARDSLFRFPPLGWLLRALHVIPLAREGTGLAGIKEALRRLKRGELVVIFPEGTRTHDGQVGHFRPGFTALAARSGAAILPAAIDGSFQAWPRSKRLPRLAQIRVHYGEPIPAAEVARRSDRDLIAEAERRVCQYVAQLREPQTD
jgi:1-acyl-sn-glycerol-3-phosphate acyltransferase